MIGVEFLIKLSEIKGFKFLAVRKTGVLNSSSYSLPPFALGAYEEKTGADKGKAMIRLT